MTWLIAALSLLVAGSGAEAMEVLRDFPWSAAPGVGTVLPPDGATAFARLRLEHPGGGAARLPVLRIAEPGIRGFPYAITGLVRHESVADQGYLELWSVFPDGGRYFSRTLGTGPLGPLRGTSDWRPFALPFFAEPAAPRPVRLEVNVVLPGRGVVELGPLRLVQYRPGEDPLAIAGAWWSDRAGGLAGGLGGATLGGAGALIGWLASRGAARRLVLGLARVVAGLGGLALCAGGVAWWRGQPYAVHYPLLLGGMLAAAVFGGLLGVLRRRYEEVELRRIRAADAR
jgi:hypothetical protein